MEPLDDVIPFSLLFFWFTDMGVGVLLSSRENVGPTHVIPNITFHSCQPTCVPFATETRYIPNISYYQPVSILYNMRATGLDYLLPALKVEIVTFGKIHGQGIVLMNK